MDKTTISTIGNIGNAAIVGVLLSEAYSSLKAQKQRLTESESGQLNERATKLEKPVEEVSVERKPLVQALEF